MSALEYGIDTYHGNSDYPKQLIDWKAIYDAGYRHVWLKATQGSSYRDPKFARDRAECEQLPFHTINFYHWVDTSLYYQQINNFLGAVVNTGGWKPRNGAMLDIENALIVNATTCRAIADGIEYNVPTLHVQGYVGVFYGNGLWKDQTFFNGKRPRILPAYVTEAQMRTIAAPYSPDVWQNSSIYTVPGVTGRCDHDIIFNSALLIASTIQPETDPMTMLQTPIALVTNSEQFLGSAPFVAKFAVKADLTLHHLTANQFMALGLGANDVGTPMGTAMILDLTVTS